MFLLSDGESVGSNRQPIEIPEPFNITDDDLCEWKADDLFVNLNIRHLAGKKITSVFGLLHCWKNLEYKTLSGYKIIFDDNDYIVYYNCGDEGKILYNKEPPLDHEVDAKWVISL